MSHSFSLQSLLPSPPRVVPLCPRVRAVGRLPRPCGPWSPEAGSLGASRSRTPEPPAQRHQRPAHRPGIDRQGQPRTRRGGSSKARASAHRPRRNLGTLDPCSDPGCGRAILAPSGRPSWTSRSTRRAQPGDSEHTRARGHPARLYLSGQPVARGDPARERTRPARSRGVRPRERQAHRLPRAPFLDDPSCGCLPFACGL